MVALQAGIQTQSQEGMCWTKTLVVKILVCLVNPMEHLLAIQSHQITSLECWHTEVILFPF